MKKNTLTDKDQAVAREQIIHAEKLNVLILRSLDLLNLASLFRRGVLTRETVLGHFMRSRGGWLRVGEQVTLLKN
jgi:hypothetical protein